MKNLENKIDEVLDYLKKLQNDLTKALQAEDPSAKLQEDHWAHQKGGGGRTRIISNGEVFERAGVNFSHVKGDALPASASQQRPQLADRAFQAMGISCVIHPKNPFVPTTHLNVRFFIADFFSPNAVWWFGGGYDLTPYYGFEEDCRHWHETAKKACDKHDAHFYSRFKQWADDYFYLKHRQEPRGIGGIFFDDLNELSFEKCFEFLKDVGNSFWAAYQPIVERRKNHPFEKKHRDFQCYRRGRYVEFNLVYDRGTLFGLQSGGRTESILMSLPPEVRWEYNWKPEPHSEEAKLYEYYLKPKDWV